MSEFPKGATMEGKKLAIRTGVLIALLVVMLAAFGCLLYYYQVANKLDESTTAAINTQVSQVTVPAARGLITDRNGTVLVGNRTQYDVTLNYEQMGSKAEQGTQVCALLAVCRAQNVEWTDTELPISKTEPYTFTSEDIYTYTDDSGATKDTRLGRLCEAMKWQRSSDAGELVAQMKETFGLTDVSETEARDALGVLYSCWLRRSEILWTDYTFATDVDINFISIIKEGDFDWVKIDSSAQRRVETSFAAHLLGQVGRITAENWDTGENYKEQGYSIDATVGLSGAEYAFESYLRGTDGTKSITTDKDGNVISEEDVVPAVAGSTVALTLDMDLQSAAEDALATYVPELNDGAGGGAAVVVSVADSGVLASASWPTFDAQTLEYDDAVERLSPLFNRALQGTYSPGSTYKMVTATAGLETGVITPTTKIQDTGVMDYYGTQFRCWLYRQSGATHGMETVSDALRDSCNIFFYQVGIDVGIETLTQYAQSYGLGVSSGIELTESTGINAGPEYSESVGQTWYAGNTLSAAIGQSDNQFTPLQLANYVATLVRGGTRYAAHLLSHVTAADGTVTEYEPQVLSTVELSQRNLDAIKQGMLEVVQSTTTVAEAFRNLNAHGIQVGAKTGSAQVSGQENANGLFVCFAPYDDPQVAVCVAVEKGGSGAATAKIAASILEQYFGISTETETTQENTPAG
jgi:penicillin-binding protein 2